MNDPLKFKKSQVQTTHWTRQCMALLLGTILIKKGKIFNPLFPVSNVKTGWKNVLKREIEMKEMCCGDVLFGMALRLLLSRVNFL